MGALPSSDYAYLCVVAEGKRWRYTFNGASSFNARTIASVKMLKYILGKYTGEIIKSNDGDYFFTQFDDHAHACVGSVAFGRLLNESHIVKLVPDTYFHQSKGFDNLRRLAAAGELPKWEDRSPTFFWRGSATYPFRLDNGLPVRDVSEIPRIRLCELVRGLPYSDVAIGAVWGPSFVEEMPIYLNQRGLLRPGKPMSEHAGYRYLLDIDGVANAWGLFERMLIGSCILKVESPFEQWFYRRLTAWRHYIPVRRDLSDLHEKMEWCLQNEHTTKDIAAQAQKLALEITFESACQEAARSIEGALIRDASVRSA